MGVARSSFASRYGFWILASLTLGLAPFAPEPHIVGKIRWVLGGADGMGAGDWFDLLLHGAPWAGLIITAAVDLVARLGAR